jgi:glycosyltransferase involved in cell wall biosynthesis
MPRHIVVDARLIGSSGIGRYLRAVLEAIGGTALRLTLLTKRRPNPHDPRFPPSRHRTFPLPVYHPLEQIGIPLVVPRCDVFFTPHFSTTSLPVRASRRVVSIHDVFHLSEEARFGRVRLAYAKYLYRSALATADEVIVPSEFTRGELIRHFRRYAGKLHVIAYSVDTCLFHPDEERPKVDGPYALFVGNLKPHKNLGAGVHALNCCGDPDLRLVVAGASSGFITGMEGELLEYQSSARVALVGIPDDRELRRLYSHAECLVFPSFYEGFGYPVLEAMACGCPVICSDIPALRETCGNAALYCDPRSPEMFADAIRRVRCDSVLRRRLLSDGTERVARYPFERFRQETIQVLMGE